MLVVLLGVMIQNAYSVFGSVARLFRLILMNCVKHSILCDFIFMSVSTFRHYPLVHANLGRDHAFAKVSYPAQPRYRRLFMRYGKKWPWETIRSNFLARSNSHFSISQTRMSSRSGPKYWDTDRLLDRSEINETYDSYVMATDRIEKLWRRHFGSLGNIYDWWLESHLRPDWKRFVDAYLQDRRRVPKPSLLSAYRDSPMRSEDFEDIRREWEESFHVPTAPSSSPHFLSSDTSSVPDPHLDPSYREYVDGLLATPSAVPSPPSSQQFRYHSVHYSHRAAGPPRGRDFSHGRRHGAPSVMTKKKARRVRRGGTYYGLQYDSDGFIVGIDFDHYRKLYRKEFGNDVVVFEDWAQPGRFGTFTTIGAQRKWVFAKDATGRIFRFRRFPHGWVGAPWKGRVPSSYFRDGGLLFERNMPDVESRRHFRLNK
jgi:hypothetical protein